MLYLFNSGFRKYHRINILNTLFLPDGCINHFRYRFRGNHININPEIHDKILKIKKGVRVLISFIDRFTSGGYRYFPFRYAEFIEFFQDQDYYHFHIKLKEFVSPHDASDISDKLIKSLRPYGLAKLTDKNTEYKDDGYYALMANKILDNSNDLLVGEQAWVKAVDFVANTKEFINLKYVFIKAKIFDDNQKKIKPVIKNNQSLFPISKGQRYSLKLSYRFPFHDNDTNYSKLIPINISKDLNLIGLPELQINDFSNNTEIPFAPKRYNEEKFSSISLQNLDEDLYIPNTSIPLYIKLSKGFWIQTIIALLLFSITSTIIGVDFSTSTKVNLSFIASSIWPKILFALVNSFILFWLFRLIGKKLF